MNMTREIIDYICSQTTFVVGTDIFQAKLTSTNDTGIIVTHSGGGENDSLMQYYQVNFIAIYDDYDTSQENLEVIWNLLSYSNGFTLSSGDYVHNSTGLKLPGFITVTEQNKYVFSCSVICNITRP